MGTVVEGEMDGRMNVRDRGREGRGERGRK